MGYTHYADIPTGRIDDKQWSNLQNEIMALTIGQPTEYIPQVIITKELIQVQGQHEWFTIQREPKAPEWKPDGMAFEFTKTARKPYDYIIVACYMSLYRCVKGVKLSSDGDYHELADGRAHFAGSLATMMMNCSESLLILFMTRDPNGMWATHAMQSVITFGKTFVIK